MRINSAAKIAWSRMSKQLIPRTDAYKMAVTTVLVLWLMQVIVGAGNTMISFENFTFFVQVWVIRRVGNMPENTVVLVY